MLSTVAATGSIDDNDELLPATGTHDGDGSLVVTTSFQRMRDLTRDAGDESSTFPQQKAPTVVGDDENPLFAIFQVTDNADAPQPSNAAAQPSSSLSLPLSSSQANNNETIRSDAVLVNFVLMAILFSANHGCVVACLSLATARLGSVGAWQSGILYSTYAFSGIVGSTYVVKELGSRNAMIFGMALYCFYVAAFYVATVLPAYESAAAGTGAVLGGIGAGFLWTAQGAYFTQASQEYCYFYYNNRRGGSSSPSSSSTQGAATAKLASIFAFIYLASEVGLRALSTILLGATIKLQWSSIFAIYALVSVVSTGLMIFVRKLENDEYDSSIMTAEQQQPSVWYKVTAAWQLLRHDRKMKLMVGLNAVFGFTAAFLTSYVNGEVVRQVTGDDKYVGVLTAWVSCVAAAFSLIFGRVAVAWGSKGPVLVTGALCFFAVAFTFLAWPDVSQWSWLPLVFVYTMHGAGRATFEGTLKATFADYFSYEKEGAFANIIFQNGMSSALGFVLTFTLRCSEKKQETFGSYCVEYKDGSFHDALSFELLIVVTALLAIAGYWRASVIQREEVARGNYENVPFTDDLRNVE